MKNCYNTLKHDKYEEITIVLKSLLVGVATGAVAILYRIILSYAEGFSFTMYDLLSNKLVLIPLALVIVCIVGYFVGYLVSKDKMISGSGIPQLKGLIKGHFKGRNKWIHTLTSKFIGGAIAIAGGLSLGREGPSIQLGACVGEGIGDKLGKGGLERKILMASGASAGLAAAFNAPMAGVIFALEEIFKYFSPVILLSTMSSAVAADFVSKQIFGLSPIFNFEITKVFPLEDYWILIILGVFLGVMGVVYNFALLKAKQLYEKMYFLNTPKKIIIPFIVAMGLGITFPVVLGGGHRIIEELTLSSGILFLVLVFLVKFIFSMISFGSGAPGGIFFPLLILGATLGAIFAKLSINYISFDQELFNNIIILAMAGYFTAIVRAPITGIVLIMEMTSSFTHILPLTVVAITAYIVANLMKSPPIYEALLEKLVEKDEPERLYESGKKTLIEIIVQHGSKFENQMVRKIDWPEKVLLVGIKRGDRQITPKGDVKIKTEDYLVILTDVNNEVEVRNVIEKMNDQ